jgi:hypothetical protein
LLRKRLVCDGVEGTYIRIRGLFVSGICTENWIVQFL